MKEKNLDFDKNILPIEKDTKNKSIKDIKSIPKTNKQSKYFVELGYEEGYKVILNFKKTEEIDLSNLFDPEIIDLSNSAFLNILEPKEIERKNYIFSAFENIDFDEVKTDFDEVNNFMLKQCYKAGFIKGFAYAMKNELEYEISLETKIEKNPLISVIIPAYNDEDTIEYAIDSVLKQTYKNIEILVIDDGSSDKTSELVKKIQQNDSRIIYIRQSNTGVAGARNRGVKESKGEYIKLCDSDDVLFPYALEMMVRALKFTNETQKFIFDDYCLYFPEDEKLLPKSMTKPKTKNEAFKIQLIGNVYPVGSVLIEKETLIKEGMFDPTLNGTDDYDLWNRLLVKHDFYKIELTPMYLQFCYKAQLSADLETLRCYTDISGLKFTNSIDFTNVIENKNTYDYMIDQMINRDDMCPSTITNLNKSFYAKNIITKKEHNNIILRTLEKSNQVFLEYHKNYITYPPDYKINEKETIAKAFIQSGFLRNKINKLSFFNDENEKFFFDFYEYEKFYGHLQLKKEDKYSHIILSNSWVYSVIPDDWITLFNTIIDRIIVPSTFIKNNYNNLGIVDYKIDVVGLPVNSSMYHKKETNYDLETNKNFNFFCISKFTKSSGIDNLIKAYTSEFTKNDDVCLIIMNDFIYDYEKKIEIEAFIENNKELPKIIIKQNNFIKEELCDIYNTVDCYVYPYSLEKFGIHVAEAMLCELPVIVTKYGATDDYCNSDNSYQIEAELIQENYTLSGINTSGDSFNFLQPDLDNLKEIMKNIFNSPKNTELGKKARKIIVEKYNEKTISDKIISIVSDVEKEPVLRTNFLSIKKKLEEKANKFFDQKNYEMSEKIFNNLSKFEKNTDFYKKLAISQYKLKKYDDAVFSFSLLIENGILTKDICIMMADSLEKIGADEEAKEFKSRAKSL
ncbi:MAG: glycosyltransferase [Cyanobacteriota bacterium]